MPIISSVFDTIAKIGERPGGDWINDVPLDLAIEIAECDTINARLDLAQEEDIQNDSIPVEEIILPKEQDEEVMHG